MPSKCRMPPPGFTTCATYIDAIQSLLADGMEDHSLRALANWALVLTAVIVTLGAILTISFFTYTTKNDVPDLPLPSVSSVPQRSEPAPTPTYPTNCFLREAFRDTCRILCNSYMNASPADKPAKAAEFCETYFGLRQKYPQLDWNCDGRANYTANLSFGSFEYKVCENRIYCFMTEPLSSYQECPNLTVQDCKRVLCTSYMSATQKNEANAAAAVAQKIQTGEAENPSCELGYSKPNNWYLRFGFATDKVASSYLVNSTMCS